MRLLCIIPGRNVFSVNIGEEDLVDELKDEMKEMAPELNTLAASALTLNQINIDTPDENEYIESQQVQSGRLVRRGIPLGRKIQILESFPKVSQ